jgi:hypothetical protein
MVRKLPQIVPMRFESWEMPHGMLPSFFQEPGAHGLMYYGLLAGKLWENQYKNEHLVYEDEEWPEETLRPFKALLQNTLVIQYNVTVDQGLRYWPAVNLQFDVLGYERLPETLMFDKKVSIQ